MARPLRAADVLTLPASERPTVGIATPMLALHAALTDSHTLLIWAEDSARGARALPPTPPATALPRAHPFAADHDALDAALTELLPLADLEDADTTALVLLLPSHDTGPQRSPALPHVDAPAPTALGPWIVPALDLSPALTLDLLLALPDGRAGDAAIGNSLRALVDVAQVALETVARGRVRPTLQALGGVYEAIWVPIEDDPRWISHHAELTEALPDLCRAALPGAELARARNRARQDGWLGVPRPPATSLISALHAALVDELVRQALRDLPAPQVSGVAGTWLNALIQPHRVALPDSAPMGRLAQRVRGWSQGVAAYGDTRLGFRLRSPEDVDEPWHLDLLLRSTRDPSLEVPAAQVWEEPEVASQLLGTGAEEALLTLLGRALRLYPALEEPLRSPTPQGIELDADAAWRFLRQTSPLLREAGFPIYTPAWWGQPTARLGLHMRAEEQDSDGVFGTSNLMHFDWQVALGEDTLSIDELQALARQKVPLVRHRGQWVEIRPDEIERAVSFFQSQQAREPVSVIQALRLGMGVEESPAGLPVLGIQAPGALGALLRGDPEGLPGQVVPPDTFDGSLRTYQQRGLDWLHLMDQLGLGACLADDMGLGKTIQVLALLATERGHSDDIGPTLVICPMSVVDNWRREAGRFTPSLSVRVHHGPDRLRDEAFEAATEDLVLTTYALAWRDRETLSRVRWHRVVLDEAQNIKNPQARQTRAIRELDATHRLALTGTPVENRLGELWSLMQFLNAGLLGSARDFKRRFATPIERHHDVERADQLRRLVRPFLLRRLKTDPEVAPDLPEKIEVTETCHLTTEQTSLYQAVLTEMMEQIESSSQMARRGLVLKTLTRLKQVCNHPAQALGDHSAMEGRSGKLARLDQLVDEIMEAGERGLIFTQYATMGTMLQGYLRTRLGIEVSFLQGSSTRTARARMIERFGAPDGPRLLILSLKAGGTGLNLTMANHVIHYDRWWNPAVENQATDRAHRIGQRRNVLVRKLVVAGTIEERIDQMIESKRALAEQIVGAGEAWITELSNDELRDLFALDGGT